MGPGTLACAAVGELKAQQATQLVCTPPGRAVDSLSTAVLSTPLLLQKFGIETEPAATGEWK